MGALASRQNAGVEEVDIGINHAYRYPPKSGNYFSSHFIMGGERFDTAQPESYLFGENTDLNFLGSRPAPFPYPAPSANEPSKTLKALINIRKESLRFVRAPDDSLGLKEPDHRSTPQKFNIEFTFDCDVRCAITIMYFCTEEVTSGGLIYSPRDSTMNSETYHYKRGVNQQFSQVCHMFEPGKYNEDDLNYSFDKEIMPIVIHCVAEEGEEPRQSHSTVAVVEKHSDGYSIKPVKQKLFVDGLCYLLQEIYGIENKNNKTANEDETEDNGAECVICMCDLRDTLILPCRHLCLCNCCANSLRYQANNCPICRAPFRALLQIKALQKNTSGSVNLPTTTEGGDSVPAGYEAVSLIEALNGPSVAPQQPPAPPCQEMYIKLPQVVDSNSDTTGTSDASRAFEDSTRSSIGGQEDSTTQTDRTSGVGENTLPTNQVRMSTLLNQELEDDSQAKSETGQQNTGKKRTSRKLSKEKQQNYSSKDSIKIVNEKGCMEETDPSEAKSLLDEDNQDDTKINNSTANSIDAICDTSQNLRAPQAEAECDDVGDEEDPEIISGSIFAPDSPIGMIDDDCVEDVQSSEQYNNGSKDRPSTSTPIKSPHRPLRRGKERVSSGKNSYLGSPASSFRSHDSAIHSASTELASLPGTPLSNSSVISRSSDASISSASSTRALLFSHPTQTTEGSIV